MREVRRTGQTKAKESALDALLHEKKTGIRKEESIEEEESYK